jgi:hypothetical protein
MDPPKKTARFHCSRAARRLSMGLLGWVVVLWLAVVVMRLRTLTGECYDHVQELIRADAHAGQRTIRAKERVATRRNGSDAGTGGLYQPTAVTPVNPFRYVILLPTPLFLLVPARRNLHGAVIRWTPLVKFPTSEWLEDLTVAVAHFLGRQQDEVDLASSSLTRKRARIVRLSH